LCAIVGGVLGYFLKNPILIAGTSLTGSYLAVSGVGLLAGHFPSILEVYEKVKNEDFEVFFSITFSLNGKPMLILAQSCYYSSSQRTSNAITSRRVMMTPKDMELL